MRGTPQALGQDRLKTVAVAVLSSIVTASVLFALQLPRRSQPSGVYEGEGREQQLEDLLLRTSKVLQRIESYPVLATEALRMPSLPQRELVKQPDLDRLTSSLSELTESFESMGMGAALGASGPAILPRDMTANIAAIEQMGLLYAGDPEGSQAELRLLTPLEVIQRFGAPAETSGGDFGDADMWWCWNEPRTNALEVFFASGYVMYAECH